MDDAKNATRPQAGQAATTDREIRVELFGGKLTLIVGPADSFGRHVVHANNCQRVLHLDKFDLTDARLRGKFVAALDAPGLKLNLTSAKRQTINRELLELAIKAKDLARATLPKTGADELGPDESSATLEPVEPPPETGTIRHDRASALLKHEVDLLNRAARDITLLGHVGDHTGKQQAMLCAISALAINDPLQPSIHAPSSSGKNSLADRALSLLPPERIIRRSALSAKALFRTEQTLKNRIIYIQEVAGSQSADYSIVYSKATGGWSMKARKKMLRAA